jgi:hypothetical protein
VQIAVPSISGKTLGTNNDHYVQLVIWAPTSLGNNMEFWLANVDVRRGTVAPPKYLRRPFSEEVVLCQRYCQSYFGLQIGGYHGTNNGDLFAHVPLKVNMRIAPTVTMTNVNYVGMNTLTPWSGTTNTVLRTTAKMTVAGQGLTTYDVLLDAEF